MQIEELLAQARSNLERVRPNDLDREIVVPDATDLIGGYEAYAAFQTQH